MGKPYERPERAATRARLSTDQGNLRSNQPVQRCMSITLPEAQEGPATMNPGPWEPLFFSTRSLILPPTKHAAGSEGALSPTVFSPQPTATRLKAPCSRMPHHADPATPGPRVTGPAGLSTEFSWGGRMPSPRGWTPMSAHFEAAPSQNSQTRVLPMSQDRGLSVFNQSMPMTEPRV